MFRAIFEMGKRDLQTQFQNLPKLGLSDQFKVGLGDFVDSFNKTKSFVIDQSRGIRRSEILKMGEQFRDGHVEAVDLFIASMMWGNGLTSYGRYRTCIALNICRNGNSPIELLNLVGQDAAKGHLEKAYKLLTNGLWWIGPAFGTKFLYFASPPTSQALIFDGLVASWRGSELPWVSTRQLHGYGIGTFIRIIESGVSGNFIC